MRHAKGGNCPFSPALKYFTVANRYLKLSRM